MVCISVDVRALDVRKSDDIDCPPCVFKLFPEQSDDVRLSDSAASRTVPPKILENRLCCLFLIRIVVAPSDPWLLRHHAPGPVVEKARVMQPRAESRRFETEVQVAPRVGDSRTPY